SFHINNRLTSPPQAWHEAAFTRIAGIWGEVIFPETCNPNNNNLVARTRIVDNTHVFVRIREIQENEGEDEDVDEDLFDEGTDGDLFCNESSKSQSSPTGSSKTGKCPLDKTPNFVPNTQIEEKSHFCVQFSIPTPY
ncbi:hypothetical protein Tco_0203779, partial [Tanacetum coccineum]